MPRHEAVERPTDPPRAGADSLLEQRLHSIAAKWPAVKFHPDDPHADLIERVAAALMLHTVPSRAVTFRQVRGCALPAPEDTVSVGAAVIEALTGAVVAAATNPTTATAGPTDPARNRLYAQQLLLHLAAAGWTLART